MEQPCEDSGTAPIGPDLAAFGLVRRVFRGHGMDDWIDYYDSTHTIYVSKLHRDIHFDELAADNLLVRRQGKGTFVATHNEDRAQFRFLRLLADDGAEHPHISRLLECRRLRARACHP